MLAPVDFVCPRGLNFPKEGSKLSWLHGFFCEFLCSFVPSDCVCFTRLQTMMVVFGAWGRCFDVAVVEEAWLQRFAEIDDWLLIYWFSWRFVVWMFLESYGYACCGGGDRRRHEAFSGKDVRRRFAGTRQAFFGLGLGHSLASALLGLLCWARVFFSLLAQLYVLSFCLITNRIIMLGYSARLCSHWVYSDLTYLLYSSQFMGPDMSAEFFNGSFKYRWSRLWIMLVF